MTEAPRAEGAMVEIEAREAAVAAVGEAAGLFGFRLCCNYLLG